MSLFLKLGRAIFARPFLFGCASLVLIGCASGQSARNSSAPPLVLGATGLLAGSTGQEVSFGRAYDGALAAVNVLAREEPLRSEPVVGCSAAETAVLYSSGLTLLFRSGGLVGWQITGDAPYSTVGGVRLGQALNRSESGTIDLGGITATLDSGARVTTLAAGARCG